MSFDTAVTAYPLTASPLSGAQASLSPSGEKAEDNSSVDAVSKDFESVFLSQMLGQMFAGDDANAYFGGGTAGDIYKSFLMNEYGKSIANAGGIGIASAVKQELLKLQEVQ